MKSVFILIIGLSIGSCFANYSVEDVVTHLSNNPETNKEVKRLEKECSSNWKGSNKCTPEVVGEGVKCSSMVTSCSSFSDGNCPVGNIEKTTFCSAYISEKGGSEIENQFATVFLNNQSEINEEVTSLKLDKKFYSETVIGRLKEFNPSMCEDSKYIKSESEDENNFKIETLSSEAAESNYVTLDDCSNIFGDKFFKGLEVDEKFSIKNDKIENVCRDYRSSHCEENSLTTVDCQKPETVKYGVGKLVSACIALRDVGVKVQSLREGIEQSYESVGGEVTCVISGHMGSARVAQTSQGSRQQQGQVYAPSGMIPLALDYNACRQAIYAYNSMFLSIDVVGEVAASGYSQIQGINIQAEEQNQAMQGNQAASLDATKSRLKMQKGIESGRMALSGAQSATLLGLMMNFPTVESLSTQLANNQTTDLGIGRNYEVVLFQAMSINRNLGQLIFPNGPMTGFLAQKSAMALSKSVVAGIKASMFGKQANMVQEVKEAYMDSEFVNDTGIALGPTYCAQNPSTPSCLGNHRRRNNNSLNFGTGGGSIGGGQAIEFGSEAEDQAISNVDKSESGPSEKIDNLDNLFNTESGDKGSKDFNNPGVASVTGKSGGGGGGGGGGGVGGGGGGGPGAGPGKKGGGSPKNFGKTSKGKYSSGTSGRSFKGGGGSKNKKNSANPFANLVGNSRSRGIATIETDKNLIAERFDLFDKISKKYAEVHKAQRISDGK
jgi:hypothetical protein